MDYIKSLLELIDAKKKISEDNEINLSLGDIAEVWHRDLSYKNTGPLNGLKEISSTFLNDIILTIKKLEKKKIIKFKNIITDPPSSLIILETGKESSVSDIADLRSLQNEISLEVIGNIDDYFSKDRESKTGKFPHKLPAGTRWENFIVKFEDDENILIKVKQFKHGAGYKELGMIGKGKSPNPSEAWNFLKVLAKCNGELTIRDKEARDKYKKQKELLSKVLQNYFSLDYDPFYPYHSSSEKSGNSYKIKMVLIPPPDKKEKPDIKEDEEDKLGIKEYFKEQTPLINEDQ